MYKILVTRKLPLQVEERMKEIMNISNKNILFHFNETDKPLTSEELRKAIEEYDILAPTVSDKLNEDVFKTNSNSNNSSNNNIKCKLIANFGVGFNHIDVKSAKQLNIAISNTPGVLTNATADLAMTLLLMTARRAGEGERLIRSNEWKGWNPTSFVDSADVTGI